MIKMIDCIEGMKALPENSVDSIVTDPPYGLEFMGKEWDKFVSTKPPFRDGKNYYRQQTDKRNDGITGQYDTINHTYEYMAETLEHRNYFQKWCYEWATEALRVLKPGGFLLAFGGTRTCHRLTCAIEDAGFEIRDMIAWIYGSGFPKSLNIGKAIDKMAGAEREVIGKTRAAIGLPGMGVPEEQKHIDVTAPATPEAKQWDGWGTALKPALEPITVARKPLSEKTVAQNVLRWGTGGINIDGCRVELGEYEDTKRVKGGHKTSYIGGKLEKNYDISNQSDRDKGRFPANLIHDGSDEVEALFPQTGISGRKNGSIVSGIDTKGSPFNSKNSRKEIPYFDSGSASRFFYCAKASKKDRDEGLEEVFNLFEEREAVKDKEERVRQGLAGEKKNTFSRNNHPTVKPTKLMQYLVRLVTLKGGTVLDPFMGSGSTGKACKLEGMEFIGFEKEQDYYNIAEARIKHSEPELKLCLNTPETSERL